MLDEWLTYNAVLAVDGTEGLSSPCWSPWEIRSMGSGFFCWFVLKKQMTISFHKNRFLARKICLKKRHILIISLLICTALGEKK